MYMDWAAHFQMRADEVLDYLDDEIPLWTAKYEAQPFGDRRGDVQAAKIASVNASWAAGRDITQWAFMPELAPETPTDETVTDNVAAALKAFLDS